MSCLCCYKRLAADEQLRVEWSTGTKVYDGPGCQCFYCPTWCKNATVVKAESLGAVDYLKVKNTLAGVERIEKGPKQVFMGAADTVVQKGHGIFCTPMEYVRVEDTLTGAVSIQKGPCTWFPNTHEIGTKLKAITCNDMEFVRVSDTLTGGVTIQRGPCNWIPGPQETGQKENCISLNSVQYIISKDKLSGKKRTVQGPCCWFPGPYEEPSEIHTAYSLKAYEYIRLLNTASGEIRSICGEQTVFPGPEESLLDAKIMQATNLKRYEFIEVLDEATGELRTVNGPTQLFLGPYERITREANALQKAHCQCGSVHMVCASGKPSAPNEKPNNVLAGKVGHFNTGMSDTNNELASSRPSPLRSSFEAKLPVSPGGAAERRFQPMARADSPSNNSAPRSPSPGPRLASPQRDRPVEG
jgi:hypothetical protein